jgi:SagB-type dehydrogenase family enzyme
MKKLGFSEIMNLLLIAVIIILIFRLTTADQAQPVKTSSKPDISVERSNQSVMENISTEMKALNDSIYQLPAPRFDSDVSIEQTILKRRSRRYYKDQALTSNQISQILWAAYGITQPRDEPYFHLTGGLKTAPSAGALYPLEIYLLAGNISDVPAGLYKYLPKGHQLKKIHGQDVRSGLAQAAGDQMMIKEAPADLVYTAIFERTTVRYKERGRNRYVPMDIGHSAENVYLQVEALGLGTCAIGAFQDGIVSQVLNLPAAEEPMYIMPIGYYTDVDEIGEISKAGILKK